MGKLLFLSVINCSEGQLSFNQLMTESRHALHLANWQMKWLLKAILKPAEVVVQLSKALIVAVKWLSQTAE